jgi:hypothetical protein
VRAFVRINHLGPPRFIVSDFPKNLKLYGPPVLLCLILAVALFTSWRASLSTSGPRAFLAFGIAGVVIWYAHNTFFRASQNAAASAAPAADANAPAGGPGAVANNAGDASVRYVIVFDSLVFTLVGLATAIAAAPGWEIALLTCGSCLLIGAFFGLLFGYPQGVAQSTPPHPVTPPGQAAPAIPQATSQKNLIAESASTLGKVIAGFTLARSSVLIEHFRHICFIVAPALGQQQGGVVLAGAIILYFFATGFFSGLLLPPYFMSGKL